MRSRGGNRPRVSDSLTRRLWQGDIDCDDGVVPRPRPRRQETFEKQIILLPIYPSSPFRGAVLRQSLEELLDLANI